MTNRPQRIRKSVNHYSDDNPSTFTVKRKRGDPEPLEQQQQQQQPPPQPSPTSSSSRRHTTNSVIQLPRTFGKKRRHSSGNASANNASETENTSTVARKGRPKSAGSAVSGNSSKGVKRSLSTQSSSVEAPPTTPRIRKLTPQPATLEIHESWLSHQVQLQPVTNVLTSNGSKQILAHLGIDPPTELPEWTSVPYPWPFRSALDGMGQPLQLPPARFTCASTATGRYCLLGDAAGGVAIYNIDNASTYLRAVRTIPTTAQSRELERPVTSKRVYTQPNAIRACNMNNHDRHINIAVLSLQELEIYKQPKVTLCDSTQDLLVRTRTLKFTDAKVHVPKRCISNNALIPQLIWVGDFLICKAAGIYFEQENDAQKGETIAAGYTENDAVMTDVDAEIVINESNRGHDAAHKAKSDNVPSNGNNTVKLETAQETSVENEQNLVAESNAMETDTLPSPSSLDNAKADNARLVTDSSTEIEPPTSSMLCNGHFKAETEKKNGSNDAKADSVRPQPSSTAQTPDSASDDASNKPKDINTTMQPTALSLLGTNTDAHNVSTESIPDSTHATITVIAASTSNAIPVSAGSVSGVVKTSHNNLLLNADKSTTPLVSNSRPQIRGCNGLVKKNNSLLSTSSHGLTHSNSVTSNNSSSSVLDDIKAQASRLLAESKPTIPIRNVATSTTSGGTANSQDSVDDRHCPHFWLVVNGKPEPLVEMDSLFSEGTTWICHYATVDPVKFDSCIILVAQSEEHTYLARFNIVTKQVEHKVHLDNIAKGSEFSLVTTDAYIFLCTAKGIRCYEASSLNYLISFGESVQMHGKAIVWSTCAFVPKHAVDPKQVLSTKKQSWWQCPDLINETSGKSIDTDEYYLIGVPHHTKGPEEVRSTLYLFDVPRDLTAVVKDPYHLQRCSAAAPVTLAGPAGGVLSFEACSLPHHGNLVRMMVVTQEYGNAWELTPRVTSNFAGPMYPVGHKVVTDNIEYIEDEDELDQPVTASYEESNVVKNEEVNVEKSDQELKEAIRQSILANRTSAIEDDVIDVLGSPSVSDQQQALFCNIPETMPDTKDNKKSILVSSPLSPRKRYMDDNTAIWSRDFPQWRQIKKDSLQRDDTLFGLSRAPFSDESSINSNNKLKSKRTRVASVEAMMQAAIDSNLKREITMRQTLRSDGKGARYTCDTEESEEKHEETVNPDPFPLSPQIGDSMEVDTARRLELDNKVPSVTPSAKQSPELCSKPNKSPGKSSRHDSNANNLCTACAGRLTVHTCGKREKPIDYEEIARKEKEKREAEEMEKMRLKTEKRRLAALKSKETRRRRREEEERQRLEEEILQREEEKMMRELDDEKRQREEQIRREEVERLRTIGLNQYDRSYAQDVHALSRENSSTIQHNFGWSEGHQQQTDTSPRLGQVTNGGGGGIPKYSELVDSRTSPQDAHISFHNRHTAAGDDQYHDQYAERSHYSSVGRGLVDSTQYFKSEDSYPSYSQLQGNNDNSQQHHQADTYQASSSILDTDALEALAGLANSMPAAASSYQRNEDNIAGQSHNFGGESNRYGYDYTGSSDRRSAILAQLNNTDLFSQQNDHTASTRPSTHDFAPRNTYDKNQYN